MPDTQARFASQGLDPAASTPGEFAALIKSDLSRGGRRSSGRRGIRAE
jgi:hypothetical protein